MLTEAIKDKFIAIKDKFIEIKTNNKFKDVQIIPKTEDVESKEVCELLKELLEDLLILKTEDVESKEVCEWLKELSEDLYVNFNIAMIAKFVQKDLVEFNFINITDSMRSNTTFPKKIDVKVKKDVKVNIDKQLK